LVGKLAQVRPASMLVKNPDHWLAILVNEVEFARFLLGQFQEQVTAPAGGVMTKEIRQKLNEQKSLFQRALIGEGTPPMPSINGSTYTLARWYAHFDRTKLSAQRH
jgi:hypothetical protein